MAASAAIAIQSEFFTGSIVTPARTFRKSEPRMIHIPENIHLWALFTAGHALHVLKRANLSVQSRISGTKSRTQWLHVNALNLAIRFFVNAAAFSYWMAHPNAATHFAGAIGVPMDLTLEPGHATAALFGLSGDSMVDWAVAKVPSLQKEIPLTSDS